MRKIATSACHPNGNSGVERVNHAMAQMLAMVVNEIPDNRDAHLPHVEHGYNNSVSAATVWPKSATYPHGMTTISPHTISD